MAPQVGVLALQGDFAAHGEALHREGCHVVWVRHAADLDRVDALVLPGGESTTMLNLLAEDGFDQHLRDAASRLPTLATCAGAILLARRVRSPQQPSLGLLDATVIRNAYGRQRESSIRRAQVEPGFERALGVRDMEAVLIRAPQFEDLGPDVSVVARAEGLPVLIRQGNLLAATFHPELSERSPVHHWFCNLLQSR
ncbi:MAG: pyridoxal 5'-phosphate synthase glutaminase subunit PdxT [Terriglobales bacterium]